MIICTLSHWKARRGRAGIYLIGTDQTGQERRIPNIRLIESRGGRLVATCE